MYIQGLGIISPAGRGLEVFREALAANVPLAGADGFCRVPEQALKDPLITKDARRSSRFDRLAILAGMDALKDADVCAEDQPSSVGLILATGLGPHVTTFKFLDDMINFKEKDVSPTLFSHSVHNAAASYLSLLAGIRGPTLTVTRFNGAFEEALSLARCWLEGKRCERVLVGGVDELGTVMEKVLRSRSTLNIPLGEGSAFFVLGQKAHGKNYGPTASLGNIISGTDPKKIATEALFGAQPCQSAFDLAAMVI